MASTLVPRRSATKLFAALFALAAAAALSAGPAVGQPSTGNATFNFAKNGEPTSLAGQGIKVKGTRGKGRTAKLKLVDLKPGGSYVARAAGKLRFSRGKKSAAISRLTFRVGEEAAVVKGRLGKRKLTVFRADGDATLGAGTLKLRKAELRLTGKAANALRKKLGLDALSGGVVGKLVLQATVSRTPMPVGKPAEPIRHSEPISSYPYASQCPVSAPVGGNPGFGHPPGQVAGVLPDPTFGPSASPVVRSSIEWGFKQSFRFYVLNIGGSGSLQALDGAGLEPNGPNMGGNQSFFDFPAAEGTYEMGVEADPTDDRLLVKGGGTALFCKSGHGFSVAMRNPAVVIDGEQSRITAEVGVNQNGTWYGFQRADIAELDLSEVEPQLEGADMLVWEDIPVTLTADGALASGLYPAGEELDPITVRTPVYPYASQCPVANVGGGGLGHPPGVVTGIAPPPAFGPESEDVVGNSLDWGFKDSFRSYIAFSPPPGSMQALDGATAVPAGPNMGMPGSFFRFTVNGGDYEAGTEPDHSDDKLLATGGGTALLCKSGHGFNIVLRNPAVTIDGASSRITADVGANLNGTWYPFQRADIADLDVSGIEPQVSGGGTEIVWENVPATMSVDGATAFGLYEAGEPLDPITVEAGLEIPYA